MNDKLYTLACLLTEIKLAVCAFFKEMFRWRKP